MLIQKLILKIVICSILLTGCDSNFSSIGNTDKNPIKQEQLTDIKDDKTLEQASKNENSSIYTDNQESYSVDTHNEINQHKAVESKPIIFGTWYLDEIVLESKEYDSISADKYSWYGKEDEYIGLELEYTEDYIRIGKEKFLNPRYESKYIRFENYKNGGGFRQPHPYEVIQNRKINIRYNENYECLADVELETFSIDFDYDYMIPYGTYIVVLNENYIFVGNWGKVILASRIK